MHYQHQNHYGPYKRYWLYLRHQHQNHHHRNRIPLHLKINCSPPPPHHQFISSRYFENEICRHLSEKGPKRRFCTPDKLKNHTSEAKGKEKKKERRGRKEKKKSKGCTLSFYDGYCLTEEVFL